MGWWRGLLFDLSSLTVDASRSLATPCAYVANNLAQVGFMNTKVGELNTTLPTPTIPVELNDQGVISVEDARRGFKCLCKVNEAYPGYRLEFYEGYPGSWPSPIFTLTIDQVIGPDSEPFEFELPVSRLSEGVHYVKQRLIDVAGVGEDSLEKQYIVDFTAPYSFSFPPAASPPANLPEGSQITPGYLEQYGGVLFTFEDSPDWAQDDSQYIYWSLDPNPEVSECIDTVAWHATGNTYFLTAAVIQAAGTGTFWFVFALMDLAGNRSRNSRAVRFTVV